MSTTPTPVRTARPGRGTVALGVSLGVLAIAAYAVQFYLGILKTPWYMPILGTLGAVVLFVGRRKQRTFVRIIGLLFWMLAGAEWFFLLELTRMPAYTGPLAAGKTLPAFTAAFADGKPFTAEDLKGHEKTVLLFFRGHW